MTTPQTDSSGSNGSKRGDDPDPQELWKWVGAAIRPHAGWIFIGAGALFILLGYLGVSHETIVGKQLPYLISGGIGGLLLAVIGAYFLGTEALRDDSGRLDRMEEQVAQLHAALLAREDAPDLTEEVSTNGSHPTSVVVIEGGETFHLPDCELATGKDHQVHEPHHAEASGLSPCPVCLPIGAS